jgi:DNA replication protein DnaC
MDFQNFCRSKALNNIPQKKLQEALNVVSESDIDIQKKLVRTTAINRYAEANIPIEYWSLKMERDFKGDPNLKVKFDEYTADMKSSYMSGGSICLAGQHGRGKTLTSTCILKKAVQKGYTALYTDLSSVVSVMTSADNDEKYLARRELNLVDFLVLDEFDARMYGSSSASDLYARTLESVFRTRASNKLPTIMCTNSPNILESLQGPLKESIGSLFNGYMTMFPVFGNDFRKAK